MILFFVKNFLKSQNFLGECFAFAWAICSPMSICLNISQCFLLSNHNFSPLTFSNLYLFKVYLSLMQVSYTIGLSKLFMSFQLFHADDSMLGICDESFWIRADFLLEVKSELGQFCIQSSKTASYPVQREIIKDVKRIL